MLVFFSPHQQNLTHLYFKFLRVGGGSLSGTPDQAYSRCVISEDAYRPLLGSGAHTGSTAYSVSQIPKRSGEKKSKSNRQRRERERISFHGARVLGFWASLLFKSIRGINLCLLKKRKERKEGRRDTGMN